MQRARHLADSAQRSRGHFVAIARVSARTLLNIANDILDLSRIEAGAIPLERKPFDLERVLREVWMKRMRGAQLLGLDLRMGIEVRVTLPLEPSEEEPLVDQSQRILKNPPGRILVVEDNPANQYVATSLLESLDCTVALARTGAEALDLLSRQTFDLVLMNCQLPGMDGFETTRRMRSVLHRYIPVIAITANAMGEDKQPCLDAGMDDLLSKPFTRSILSDLLCKWLVPGEQAIIDSEMPERIVELPVLAGAVFDELWESLQWRVAPLRKIYHSFLAVAHETLDTLNRAATADDGTVLARRLHTLLGSAGMVGARQVERVAAWLQEAVKQERRADLEAGRVLLASALRRFETELERRLDSVAR